MNTHTQYFNAVQFLEGLQNLPLQGDYMIDAHHEDAYLKRMRYFLKLLGNPDKKLHFIHITGTAGKGSVTNMIHEVLHAAGKNVGSFTSPHIASSIERIKVKNLYISPEEFAAIVEYLQPFIDKAYHEGPYGRPSYFEIFLAIALIYFQQKNCEWVILEVGLGGRYDATNVIEGSIISAITNIDYDHTELLGKTLKKIAHDKAGIIKPGTTFFTTEQNKSLIKVFNEICTETNVPLNQLPPQENYQKYNEELTTAITKKLKIEERYIQQGIKKSRLMCRFEIMQTSPTVVLDGAHNRSKIRATINNLEKLNFEKVHLIIGIANNKNHRAILKEIIPHADTIIFTKFKNINREAAHPNELLKECVEYLKKNVKPEICLDAETALTKILKKANTLDLVLVVGSFFLAGELRTQWFTEEYILKNRKGF